MSSWTSRRRSTTWATSSESSALEVERSRYATFTGSFPRKRTGGFLDFIRGKAHSLWTITSVVAGGVFLYRSFHHHHHDSSVMNSRYDMTPISEWDHNHYVSRDSLNNAAFRERNLLIAQIGQSRPLAEISSRPNRAYARRWRWDYLVHVGEEEVDDDNECGTVRVLNHIMARQEREATITQDGASTELTSRAPYDAILFLPPDAVIMDLDYQFLALLPDEKLVAASTSKSDLFLWNLNRHHSLDVARLWLDLGDDSKCDMESLWSAIEMTMQDKVFDLSEYVQPLQVSDAGQVEPRLIKFLPDETEQNLSVTIGVLESVADSVCYRYYPRCEVL